MNMNRQQLEEGRIINNCVYGYKKSYCNFHDSCSECDKIIRFSCKIISKIKKLQDKRILKVCK